MIIDKNTVRQWMESGYVGDFAVRQMNAHFGVSHEGHAHWIDHLTIITKGPVRIDWTEGNESGSMEIHQTPWVLNMPAERWHKFTALTEGGAEWFCIFSGAQADSSGVKREDFNYEKLTHG